MKFTLKLFLVVCLFSSVAFAEGEMGNGGKSCTQGQPNCLTGNQPTASNTDTNQTDSILVFIQKYLISIFV